MYHLFLWKQCNINYPSIALCCWELNVLCPNALPGTGGTRKSHSGSKIWHNVIISSISPLGNELQKQILPLVQFICQFTHFTTIFQKSFIIVWNLICIFREPLFTLVLQREGSNQDRCWYDVIDVRICPVVLALKLQINKGMSHCLQTVMSQECPNTS